MKGAHLGPSRSAQDMLLEYEIALDIARSIHFWAGKVLTASQRKEWLEVRRRAAVVAGDLKRLEKLASRLENR